MNSLGRIFKITTFGESHGEAIGVVIDGCPAGLKISPEEIQTELDKRRGGQSAMTTARKEKDQVEILSGIFEGRTLGTPIALIIKNQNTRSRDYESIKNLYRPGHADYVYDAKYGHRDWRGGGRASARETAARVAAGAVAKKLLLSAGVEIIGNVVQVGNEKGGQLNEKMKEIIARAKAEGDSVGGVVEVVATGVPVGWGEPVFGKLSSDLARALVSIPAVKGFEIGDGFECATKLGSENNDALVNQGGQIKTASNHAGGIVGGISNGENIVLRVALKPA